MQLRLRTPGERARSRISGSSRTSGSDGQAGEEACGQAPAADVLLRGGPTGYGLYRLIKSLGHECIVVAPSLIPKRPGDRVKTNRRDALSLVKLLRAGELTAVWVPDRHHEAIRDLTRARGTAALESAQKAPADVGVPAAAGPALFENRHTWTKAHMSWLASQKLAQRSSAWCSRR